MKQEPTDHLIGDAASRESTLSPVNESVLQESAGSYETSVAGVLDEKTVSAKTRLTIKLNLSTNQKSKQTKEGTALSDTSAA